MYASKATLTLYINKKVTCNEICWETTDGIAFENIRVSSNESGSILRIASIDVNEFYSNSYSVSENGCLTATN
jgi:hypothetical protein